MSTSIINFRKGFSDVIYDEDFLTVLPKRIIGKDVPHAHSFKKWMSSSDANNGGTSFCSFSANNSLVFKGRVVFDEEIAQRMHTRSGFCALRGSLKDTLDLRDYEGLELYMKSNTPVLVTLNMGCESYFDSDIFQFHFHVQDTWRKYHIPFHKFMWVNYLRLRSTCVQYLLTTKICSSGLSTQPHNTRNGVLATEGERQSPMSIFRLFDSIS